MTLLLVLTRATLLLVAVLSAIITSAGCGYDGPMLTIHELKAGLDDPSRKIHIVDVRPKSEFSKGHLDGAINIPLPELEHETGTFAALDGEIAVICNCGKGALAAARQLQERGIPAALVKGGYKEWTAAGYPVIKHSR